MIGTVRTRRNKNNNNNTDLKLYTYGSTYTTIHRATMPALLQDLNMYN